MSAPSFSTIDFDAIPVPAHAPRANGTPWETPERILVESMYGAQDLASVAHLGTMPGLPPFLRGPYPTM